jgi:hypothetical protein
MDNKGICWRAAPLYVDVGRNGRYESFPLPLNQLTNMIGIPVFRLLN